MAFSKKTSRPITVDSIGYRYQISTSVLDDDRNLTLNVSVLREGSSGAMLKIEGLVTRDYWLDFADGITDVSEYPVIKPRHTAELIRKGIAAGWQADVAGQPHILRVTNEAIFEA